MNGEFKSEPGGMERDSSASLRILVIDDEASIRRTLELCLSELGHSVVAVGTAPAALTQAGRCPFDLAFLDLRLGGDHGLELIPKLLDRSPWLKIVVITAYATIESAVEAMRRGATEYLPKPFSPDQVRMIVRKAGRVRFLETKCHSLDQRLRQIQEPGFFDSGDAATMRVLETARQAAGSEATILIEGETGTGKSLLAHAIHDWSARKESPFYVVSCPSLNPELLESELFGHVRGAFTGAVRDNPGKISSGEGGTIFLDEIGDLPLHLQPKLLRFLQERQFERVGDPTPRNANVRVVAATNVGLKTAVDEGRFRADLFHRLGVIVLRIPPLRERKEDIPVLAGHFLAHFSMTYRKPARELLPEAKKAMMEYSWPGNIRELRNIMERAVILNPGAGIGLANLPEDMSGNPSELRPGDLVSLAALEKDHIRRIMEKVQTLQEAADILGIDVATLYRKRKNLDF